jgi:hypothetical protein
MHNSILESTGKPSPLSRDRYVVIELEKLGLLNGSRVALFLFV